VVVIALGFGPVGQLQGVVPGLGRDPAGNTRGVVSHRVFSHRVVSHRVVGRRFGGRGPRRGPVGDSVLDEPDTDLGIVANEVGGRWVPDQQSRIALDDHAGIAQLRLPGTTDDPPDGTRHPFGHLRADPKTTELHRPLNHGGAGYTRHFPA
jgi:hypothetical protein